jgi:predicted MFS family arabinose efflux permease
MADRYSVAPMLIPIAVSFNVPLSAASGAASLYFLAYGLMPPVYGLLADRLGRIAIIRATLVGTAIADLLSALSPNLTFLLAARFVTGGLACGVFPTTLVYIGDRFAFNVRQQAITNVLVWVAIGTAAGTIAAGLVTHVTTWRLFFLIPAAIAVIAAAMLRRVPESLAARSTNNPFRQLGSVLRHPWARFLLFLSVPEGAVMFGLVTYLAPALEARGQSAAVAGVVVGTYGLAVLIGTRLFRYVARRLTPALILAGGGSMLLLGFVIAAGAQTVATILVASTLAGGAYAFMHSTVQTWATDVVPEARGTATALFATAIFGGAALATSGVAGLASTHRYGTLFGFAALLTVPVVVAGSVGRWRYRGSGSADLVADGAGG